MSCCSCNTPVASSCCQVVTGADLADLIYLQGLDINLCTKFQAVVDAIQLRDCEGNAISSETPIVTCAAFEAEICAALLALSVGAPVVFGTTQVVGADCELHTIVETPLVFTDTSTVDGTTSGPSGHNLTAVVRVSAVAGNEIIVQPDGIYAPDNTFVALDTSCINLTITEAPANTWTVSADPIISPNAGNTLSCLGNGLFVPTPAVTDVTILATDTNCLNMDIVEGPANTFNLTGNPIISPDVGNALSCTGNGLFVATPAVAVPVTVLDTPSVNLTLVGQQISADVVISPDASNQISINPNGLFVPDTIFNVLDTACLNLDIIEGPANTFQLTGNPIISPNAGNAISCTGNGLFVGSGLITCEALQSVFTPSPSALPANGAILGADCMTYLAPGVIVTDTACINMSVTKGAGHNYSVSAVPILADTYPGYPAGCNSLQCTGTGLASPPDIAGAVDTVLSVGNIHPSGPFILSDVYASEVLHLDIVNTSDCRSAILTTVYRHPQARTDFNAPTPGCFPFRVNVQSFRNTNLPGVEVISTTITESNLFSSDGYEGLGIQHSETILVYTVPPGFSGSIEMSVVATVQLGCGQALFIEGIRMSYTLVSIGL